MSVLILLIFASLAVATAFLAGFIWAVRSGQYEDTYTPSMRLLLEEPLANSKAVGRDYAEPTSEGSEASVASRFRLVEGEQGSTESRPTILGERPDEPLSSTSENINL